MKDKVMFAIGLIVMLVCITFANELGLFGMIGSGIGGAVVGTYAAELMFKRRERQ